MKVRALSLLLAVVLASGVARAAVYRVNGNAAPTAQDGTTWQTAFTTVQAGLNAASPTDEVWVAKGVYLERITLRPRVALYGGFAGSEMVRDQRDFTENSSILDGNLRGTVVTASAFGATIDGFTIRHGSSSGVSCTVDGVTISNNIITGNSIDLWSPPGGGIRCEAGDGIVIRHNTVVANKAGLGGGIGCRGGSVTIVENTISNNQAARDSGGGIYTQDTVVIVGENQVSRNSVGAGGGSGGGGMAIYAGKATVQGNIVSQNSIQAGYGTAILVVSTGSIVQDNKVTENTGPYTAGAIRADGGVRTVNNSVTANSGHGITAYGTNTSVINNTVTGNSGVGLYFYGSGESVNNIIAFNGAGVYQTNGTFTLRNNCVYGNTKYDYGGVGDQSGKNGNLKVDPQLANVYREVRLNPNSPCVDAGDDSFVPPNSTDLDAQPRINGRHVDIGAYETDGQPRPVPVFAYKVSPAGDDSGDGLTWATAKRTLNGALTQAAGGDEVWVAAGTYRENIAPRAGVSVYGGFQGSEFQRSQRNWPASRTVLDGNKLGPVASFSFHANVLDGFEIRNGKSSRGAGICSSGSDLLTVIHNTVIRNSAGEYGGGIYHSGGQMRVTDNVIAYNDATDLTGNGTAGGGVYIASGTATILNNTIADNQAVQASNFGLGGGVYWVATTLDGGLLANNTIAFNSSGISLSGGGITIRSNNVYGNAVSQYLGISDQTGKNGNIKADPKFTDEFGGDFRLSLGSPAVNAGDSTLVAPGSVDLDLQPRIIGPAVDMGAYEYGNAGGTAYRLLFSIQPGSSESDKPFAVQPQVAVMDVTNNPVGSFIGPVTVLIKSGPAGATLIGQTTVTAVNGVANFTDLKVDKVGTYLLTAMSDGLVSADSQTFTAYGAVYPFGDLNRDGVFDISDLSFGLRVLGGMQPAPQR